MTFFNCRPTKLHLTFQQKRFIEKVYERESRRMWYTAYRVLNNKDLADDVLQQAFEKILKKIDLLMSFDYSDNFGKVSKYMLITARNTAINLNKADKFTANIADFEYELGDGTDVESAVMTKIEIEHVFEAINEMDIIYQDVMYLRFILDLKFQDVAEILGITESAARQRVSYVKQHLRCKKDGDSNG